MDREKGNPAEEIDGKTRSEISDLLDELVVKKTITGVTDALNDNLGSLQDTLLGSIGELTTADSFQEEVEKQNGFREAFDAKHASLSEMIRSASQALTEQGKTIDLLKKVVIVLSALQLIDFGVLMVHVLSA